MPACSPRCTSDSANGSAHRKMTPAAYASSSADDDASLASSGSAPIRRAGPTRCGSSDGARQMRIHEHHEDADEDHRVDERERALERQRQRVERRQREERDLDRVRPFEVHVGVELAL